MKTMETTVLIFKLMDVATDEDLNIIKDAIYSLGDYRNEIFRMEYGIQFALKSKGNMDQRDLVAKIERLNMSRTLKHNSAIISTKILNRLCDLYDVELIFKGDIEDRVEVAAFAKVVFEETGNSDIFKR